MPTGVLLSHLHVHHGGNHGHKPHGDVDNGDVPTHVGGDMYIHPLLQPRKMIKGVKMQRVTTITFS